MGFDSNIETGKAPLGPLKELARRIRIRSLKATHEARSPHIGSCLSIADILAALYGKVLNVNPSTPAARGRDRFILSKGHAAAALYAALAEAGFLSEEELRTFGKNGSRLAEHVSHHVPGVEVSTGSLGHGLGFGVGFALAGRHDREPYRVFVLLSDGELQEGSCWEAFLVAGHHRLENLACVVDYNRMQSLGAVQGILNLEPLVDKLQSFGWAVRECDGHDPENVAALLNEVPFEARRPSCLLAHTVKGKGISFMEHQLLWHYRSPDNEDLQRAMRELQDSE